MSDNVRAMPRPIRVPGPAHPISIEANPRRVVVTLDGLVLADSRKALVLREAHYPPVQYIPIEDVAMTLLVPSEYRTYCPYKGDCEYFSIPAGGARSMNAAWTYRDPYPSVSAIREYLAFYPDRVDAIEERAA